MKCVKCSKEFEPQPDTPEEHKGLCPYCCIRYEMALVKIKIGKKGEAREFMELTDEQIDKGMERIAQAMRVTMISFSDIANAMRVTFQLAGGALRKELKELKEDNR